jgi:hypothetical protein
MNCRSRATHLILRHAPWLALGSAIVLAGCISAPPVEPEAPAQRYVTQGLAKNILIKNLYPCAQQAGVSSRPSAVATITATDGTVLTVPTETALQKGLGPKSVDLFNVCTGVTPNNSKEVSTAHVPVIEVDPDGEVITGYIVADNYFEFYVNGKLVSVDSVPFTPFNSTIVKFRAKRPITYAFLVVDWEEDMGLGTEPAAVGGAKWHQGDGGLIARFSDGTVTDSSWKAQTFYIAPLNSPNDVIERGNVRDTTKLGRIHPHAPKPGCEDRCYAVHYRIPANWASPRFDDSKWPRAHEYTDTDIGVNQIPGYTRFPDLFEGSRWIWTLNLVFDNVVVARKTVR